MRDRLLWTAIVLVGFSACAHAGTIEICKVSDPSGSLVDPFYYFTIAGEPQLGTILVPVDACSNPISLPDGGYVITEASDATSQLEDVYTFPEFALVSYNLATDSATVLADGGTDLSQEVTVSFVNTPDVITPDGGSSVPEPATGWPVGLGLAAWVLRRVPPRRPSRFWRREARKRLIEAAIPI